MSAGGEQGNFDPAEARQVFLGIKGSDIMDRNASTISAGASGGYSLNGESDAAASAAATDASSASKVDTDDNMIFETAKNDEDVGSGGQDPFCQNIYLTGSEEKDSFPVYGSDVTVWCSSRVHTSGSSKVKLDSTLVNYGWANRYYFGQQVAVDPTREYIAYAILSVPKNGDGAIRVTKLKKKHQHQRELLRGMKGAIVDLAFAHCVGEVLLASVDEFGTLFVHSVSELDSKLVVQALLTVRRVDAVASFYGRVVWCHYIPEDITPDDEDDGNGVVEYDLSKRLAVINNNTAEVFNVDAVVKDHGSGPLNISDISSGYQVIAAHTMPITSATLSPDGTALATISCDGKVKFFQIYLQDTKEQRCLHEWNPHNGKPLSCLFFLDDHSSAKPESQFWKFAVTGADMNRELKVWNCALWTCLQTIRFEVPSGEATKPELQAGMDITASYLLLSDVRRNVMYILNIYLDVEKSLAQISCVSEFPLTSPVLSYAILSASRKKLRPIVEDDQLDDNIFGDNPDAEMDDDDCKNVKDDREDGVVLKLIYVQPKSLQKCTITYHPSLSISNPVDSASSFSLDTISFKDRLSDLNYDACSSDASGAVGSTVTIMSSAVHDLSGQLLLPPQSFTLEVPSANAVNNNNSNDNVNSSANNVAIFVEHDLMSHRDSTPVKSSRAHLDGETPTPIPMREDGSVSSERSRTSSENKEDGDDEDDETIVVSYDHVRRGIGMLVHSNGSSPSLEVQEILNKDLNKDMEFVEQNSQKHLPVNNTLSSATATDLNDLLGLNSHGMSNRLSTKAKSLSPQPTFSDGENVNVGANHLVKWPTAPKVPEYEQRKRRTLRISPKSAVTNDGNIAWTKNVPIVTSDLSSDRYEYLARSIWALTQTIETQKCELQYLRQTVAEMKTDVGEAVLARGVSNELLKNNIQSSLKSQLHKQHKEDNAIIANLLRSHDERLVSQLMQTVSATVITRLDTAVQTEFRNSIVPRVMHEVETLKNTMHIELAQKLASTDNLMRENITRIAESKSISTSIAHAVASSLRDSTQAAFKEILQNVVVPSFEKSCQGMFHQVCDAFHKGSKEYITHMEKSLDKQQRDAQTMMTSQMQEVIESIQSRTENVAEIIGEQIDRKLRETLTKFEDELSQRFSSLVQKEMSVAIKEHQAAIGSAVANVIRSRAVTPVPPSPMDRSMQQAHILQLLQHGELNSAFQQALSASDLNLVMFVCDKVNPGRVFGESPCPLQQPVLLSLIHHLAAELNTRTELKHDFLQEALVIVDVDDPVTCNHVPVVMEALQVNLRQYIKNNPSGKLTRNMKVLLMATDSVLHRRMNAALVRKPAPAADMFTGISYALRGESPCLYD